MTIDALPTKAPFQVFQHTNVITYVGIATHIGRGCEAFNPARHIVVPWLLMIFGANCLFLGLGNFLLER